MVIFSKRILEVGNGISRPGKGHLVTVEGTVWVYDVTQSESRGKMLDLSNRHGDSAFVIGAGMVIEGMELAATDMTLGEKSIFTIPSHLARSVLNTADADLIFEVKFKSISVPRRFNLPENMLLLSLILIVADGRHRKGFTLPLDLTVGRPAGTWTPELEKWSDKMWEHVLLHITRHWRPLLCFSLKLRDLRQELSVVIDELKRISGGEENIFRKPRPILEQTAISSNTKSECQGLTGNCTWRLLCLSVAVEFGGEEPGPDLTAAATYISELRSLLNQSPLFAASPISYAETALAFQILQRWLFPPSNHPSDIKASSGGTLAVPHKVIKRSSTEFASSPTKSPRSKREKGDRIWSG